MPVQKKPSKFLSRHFEWCSLLLLSRTFWGSRNTTLYSKRSLCHSSLNGMWVQRNIVTLYFDFFYGETFIDIALVDRHSLRLVKSLGSRFWVHLGLKLEHAPPLLASPAQLCRSFYFLLQPCAMLLFSSRVMHTSVAWRERGSSRTIGNQRTAGFYSYASLGYHYTGYTLPFPDSVSVNSEPQFTGTTRTVLGVGTSQFRPSEQGRK